MLLEIIFTLVLACGVLFGGMYFVRVYQQNTKPTKIFKVTDKNRTRTVLLPYISFESFTEKCRAKFNLRNNGKIMFESGEDEEIEVDKECLDHLEDKSLLIVKGDRDASGQNDNHDCDDDALNYLGNQVRGRTSERVDTVIDNADMNKWWNVQEDAGVKQHILKHGLKGITSVLSVNMNVWKSKPLNIAVTGESGKGKSSFINAFRGVSAGDKGAAKIDEVECTIDCRAFRHPKYDSFVLWDVPGVGTKTFPKENYLNAIQIDRFDFFMIVSSTRFTELETWLAKEVMKRKKRFYFIRTKIDEDMKNKKTRFEKQGKHFNKIEEFKEMKTDINKELHDVFNVKKLHFFMISNNHPGKYDFPFILDQLLRDVPDEKKDAMVFGLRGMSQNVLEEKASALRSRIWKVALLSAVGAGIPIPFVSAGIDAAVILEEILFYREQFGLDDQSLEHLADMAGTSLEDLKKSVDFRAPNTLFTSAGLAKFLTKYVAREVAEQVVKFTIPVVGVAISCGISYNTTMGILAELLEIMKQDAQKVLEYVIKIKGTAV